MNALTYIFCVSSFLILLISNEKWKRKYEDAIDINYLLEMQRWRQRYFDLERKSGVKLTDKEFYHERYDQ